jgi:hypothetical protein
MPPRPVRAAPSALSRLTRLWLGVAMMVASPLAAPLPGPGGILVFAGGLALVLRASPGARLRFVRLKRRWPRAGALADRALRRRSARRRRARAAAD